MADAKVLGHIPMGELPPSTKVLRQNRDLHQQYRNHQKWMRALNKRRAKNTIPDEDGQ